jgi:hypothetical protein
MLCVADNFKPFSTTFFSRCQNAAPKQLPPLSRAPSIGVSTSPKVPAFKGVPGSTRGDASSGPTRPKSPCRFTITTTEYAQHVAGRVSQDTPALIVHVTIARKMVISPITARGPKSQRSAVDQLQALLMEIQLPVALCLIPSQSRRGKIDDHFRLVIMQMSQQEAAQ